MMIKLIIEVRWWWHMPLIPHLRGRGRQILKFEASLVYKVSSRTAMDTQRNPVSNPPPPPPPKRKKMSLHMLTGSVTIGVTSLE